MSAVATHYAGSATREIRTVAFILGKSWTFPVIDLSGGNLRGTPDARTRFSVQPPVLPVTGHLRSKQTLLLWDRYLKVIFRYIFQRLLNLFWVCSGRDIVGENMFTNFEIHLRMYIGLSNTPVSLNKIYLVRIHDTHLSYMTN